MKISNATKVLQTLDTKLLFNIKITEEVINNIIADDDFPCLNYIYHFNGLIKNNYYKKDDILKFKIIFYNNRNIFENFNDSKLILNKDILFDEENCLFSRNSSINIIERILKYGKFKNNIVLDFNDEILTKMLLLNVFETTIDEIVGFDETHNEIMNLYLSVITYNQFPNDICNSNYFRLPYMYENYIKNNSEVLNAFKMKNDYSLKNYLLFLQMFFLSASHNNAFIHSNVLNQSSDAFEIRKCIHQHTFDYTSDEQKNMIEINAYIPSQALLEKPLLLFNNKYLLINPGFLMERIFGIFFKKIKLSFSNNAIFKKSFYGPLFENYCRDIARMYTNKSKFKHYKFVEEFKYIVDGNEKKSSDFYITYKDITIIFEIKSTQRFCETTTQTDLVGKEKYVKDEINTKIVKPLTQIEARLAEIKQLDSKLYPEIPLLNIQISKKYFYIIVSDESIINNYKLYNDYLSKLKVNYSAYVPIYLNISEFEFLMMSLYKRKKPIDKVLEHYHKQYYSSNFFDMISKEQKTFKFSKLDIFDKYSYMQEIYDVLSNK